MTVRFHKDGVVPAHGSVYVYGGNMAGKLVSPNARTARNNFRVAYGTTEGRSEMAYAIPVRSKKLEPLEAAQVGAAVERFIAFAHENPKQEFFVTRVGCEPGELGDTAMAAFFSKCPSNCSVPDVWRSSIEAAIRDEAEPAIKLAA